MLSQNQIQEEDNNTQKYYNVIATQDFDYDNCYSINLKGGYTEEDLKIIPKECCIAYSCGNPVQYANIQQDEKIVDLGSGTGNDLFLISSKLQENNKVVGIDFTQEMVAKTKKLIQKYQKENKIDVVRGSIENMDMFQNETFDVANSNCVLNLLTNKLKGYQEINRILKQGGRVVFSDIVLKKDLPKELINANLAVN